MRAPCWQCIRRYPACHGSCGDYAQFRMKLDAENKKRRHESEMRDYEKSTGARLRARYNTGKFGGRDEK